MSNDPCLSLPSEPERETLDLPELAERLGVSRSSIYRWADAGIIPTIRLGRRRLVPRVAVDDLLSPRSASTERLDSATRAAPSWQS